MQVALITSDYPPQCTSAAVQMRDLAREMVRQSHQPVVIVPTVDLGSSWTTETVEGVQVLRLSSYRIKDTSYLWRTLAELLLPFIMMFRLRKTPFHNIKWNLVVWYSPTIFFGPLIWALKRKSGCRSYLILRDIFPEWAVDLGIIRKGPVYTFFKAVANFQYMMADTIGVQTPSNMDYFEDWARKPNHNLEVLQNWLATSMNIGSSIKISESRLAGRKIFVYVGNMGVAQGMDIMINLADSLKYREDIGFLFVGRGSEMNRLKKNAEMRFLTNVQFFDEIDSNEIHGLLSQCYAGLLTLDPRHKSHNIPGKFLTYLLAGLPIIARVNENTDLAKLIKDERIGRVHFGESVEPLHDFVEEVADMSIEYVEIKTREKILAERMFSPVTAVSQIIATVQ